MFLGRMTRCSSVWVWCVSKAFASVTNQRETNILDNYSKNYLFRLKVFRQVKKYIGSQAVGFRINFFVDEVGQYISDNVKLMTNLQTIAESLNTICGGQAWIIVTAQEALDKVVATLQQSKQMIFQKSCMVRYSNALDQ